MEFLGSNAKGHYFYYIGIAAAIILLLFFKGRRKWFVIPTLLMGVVIANPWFKEFWESTLEQNYYWRLLWIVPVIPICAALPAMISERIKNQFLKGFVAFVFLALFILSGSYVYQRYDCQFVIPAKNADKLPSEVVEVADTLLEMDDSPRIVGDRAITIYIRQYTGEIDTLYGRDINGFIWSRRRGGTIQAKNPNAWRVKEALENREEDLSFLPEIMKTDGFEYLVTKPMDDEREWELQDNGFILEREVAG